MLNPLDVENQNGQNNHHLNKNASKTISTKKVLNNRKRSAKGAGSSAHGSKVLPSKAELAKAKQLKEQIQHAKGSG